MDDFLHNLRSGKLKQQDRGRSYNDPQYKGGQRRGAMDRRKKELEAFERLNAVKEVLETISETQKRMADAYNARTKAENRKARAMEILAKNLYRMLNPDADAEEADRLFAPEPEPVLEIEAAEPEEAAAEARDADTAPGRASSKLSDKDRKELVKLIGRMRDKGNKWEQIARHIASEGFPTASGKGNWRGVMVKNLYEKMSV